MDSLICLHYHIFDTSVNKIETVSHCKRINQRNSLLPDLFSDINECSSEALNDCKSNDLCQDVDGSYTCTCATGYKLKSDARTCVREYHVEGVFTLSETVAGTLTLTETGTMEDNRSILLSTLGCNVIDLAGPFIKTICS